MPYFAVKELNKKLTLGVNYTGGFFMSKRITALLCVFSVVFCTLAGRCAYISLGNSYNVSDSYNSYTVNIGTLYTNIYDRTGRKLNNYETQKVAVIRPNEKALSELDKLFTESEIDEITEELKKGYPIVRQTDKDADLKYIDVYEKIVENSDNMLARHMLDRTYGGVENWLGDEIGSLSVNFTVDALGRLLAGDEGKVIDNNYSSVDGIVISLDSTLQKIAEDASSAIPKGAVVIMDIENSRILAAVSRGDDYVNRALSSYAIGSIFKLVVSACAIENGITPLYICQSDITVGDTKFHCQKNTSHGLQSISDALANSCNCYFVNLALRLGSEKLYETAKNFGFGEYFNILNDKRYSAGNFPALSTLKNSKGQLALIGFGQGELTDSPVHFASVISCIANGGSYLPPTLDIFDAPKNRIISKNTSDKLMKYMNNVVQNGTGKNAYYKNMTAGKTATAQSGIYKNGVEILNTWFAGFYPYNNPEYAIVVMQENGDSGAGDCCPVFRDIVEKIDKL